MPTARAFANADPLNRRVVDQMLINNGTIPSTSPVAALRNGKPLQPEQAINYSAGTVVDSGTFTFTADYFRINVDDRLTITRNYTLSPDEKTTLIWRRDCGGRQPGGVPLLRE